MPEQYIMFPKDKIEKFSFNKTPFYYYDTKLLKATLGMVRSIAAKNGFVVHYALKANSNDKILRIVREYGMGADCVSGNEVKKALEIGFSRNNLVFAGVGKSDDEINIALDEEIFCFNSESLQEIEVINGLASEKKKMASIALRINPNISANTHEYITTGLTENKFGINMLEIENVVNRMKELRNVKLIGIHFHIGSQITDLDSFKNLCTRVNEIQSWFGRHNISIEHVNVGGGLGIDYHHPDEYPMPDFESYFNVFKQFLELRPGQKLHFELGRAIVGQCGSLISKVLYVKKGVNTDFVILDAGMTELIRPALYQSYHKIENLSRISSLANRKYNVVGPICESSDCFGKALDLPETFRGDIISIRSTGAYGETMVSQYNLRDKVKAYYSEELSV